jgi:hypothetical protein
MVLTEKEVQEINRVAEERVAGLQYLALDEEKIAWADGFLNGYGYAKEKFKKVV